MKDSAGVGKAAPTFNGKTTEGMLSLPEDHKGYWTVLYWYIADFSPSAASDILALDKIAPKLSSYNTKIAAMSPDSVETHIAWALDLRNQKKDGKAIGFPLISDRSGKISKLYGITNTDDDIQSNEKAVMIIDPDGVIRSFHRLSHGTGINVTEIERELLALQTGRYQQSITPAGWTPGEDILNYPPDTLASAQSAIPDMEAQGMYCLDWYICFKQDTGKRKED